MSEHFVLPVDEAKDILGKIHEIYDGLERWQRDEAYYQARKRGLDRDDAWIEMTHAPVEDLPKVVFVWDGIRHDVPELESVK